MIKKMKHGEYFTNSTLEEAQNQDIYKVFFYDETENTLGIYTINDTSNDWKVTYVKVNIADIECNLKCLECSNCLELIKKEENGEYDVWFRNTYHEAIRSITSEFLMTKDNHKWVIER